MIWSPNVAILIYDDIGRGLQDLAHDSALLWRGWPAVLSVLLGGAAVWLVLHVTYGRETKVADPPAYRTTPPRPWPPCQVSYLLRWGDIAQPEFVATVLDLVRRGALEVVVARRSGSGEGPHLADFALRRTEARAGKMLPSERYLVEKLLFEGAEGDVHSLAVLRQRLLDHAWYNGARGTDWRRLAEADARADPFYAGFRASGLVFARVVGAALVLASPLLGFGFHAPSALLVALLGITMGACPAFVSRHTPDGAAAVLQWRAYRRFLADPSDPDLPGLDPSASECSLAYAEVLGVASAAREKLLRYGDRPVPATEGEDGFTHWYFADGPRRPAMAAFLRAHADLCGALWQIADYYVNAETGIVYD